MKPCLFLLSLITLVASCGPSQQDYNALVDEKDKLAKQNEFLSAQVENYKAELEKYQMAPSILYEQAQDFIKTKNRNGLNNILQQLKKYHPSSSEYQKVATALSALDKEIEKEKAAEKAKRMQAVNKLKSKYDDISGTTWYYNPYFTHYTNSNHISIYMGKKKTGSPWLRLLMSYYGDDWIFFDNAYLSYDENTREITFDKYKDKETENSGGYVWEWIDVGVDSSILSYLRQMVDGKSVKMRLSGKYTKTRTLTASEINGIKDVLLAYDVLLKGE